MELKPWMITELEGQYPTNPTLSELQDLVMEGTGRTFTCPKCSGSGLLPDTDPENEGGTVECNVCDGWGKTVYEIDVVAGAPSYVPIIPPPEEPEP